MLKVILLSFLFFVGNAWAESIEQLKVKAEQGDGFAQFNLGFIYDGGQGVLQDYKEAVKWYRLAAEQGLAAAQFNLGGMYGFGKGVLQDYKLAHMWWNIAAIDGDERASKNREIIEKRMSSEDLRKAQDMAREWVKNHK